MMFSSRYTIDIPPIDVLSYIFDEPDAITPEVPLYISAEDPSQIIHKSELKTLVKKLAGGLRRLGHIGDGDVVLVAAKNSIWYPVITLGTICAGGIFTGTNPGSTSTEITHQLEVSGAKCIVCDSQRLSTVLEAARAVGIPASSVFVMGGIDSSVKKRGVVDFESLLWQGEFQWQRSTDLDAVSNKIAALNFSSGTTGPPKACMITHRNLVANAEQTLHLDRVAGERQGDALFGRRDVHCAYVPLYHAIGLLTYGVVNVRRGCTTVVMSQFDLRLLLESIQLFRVSSLLLVPPVAVLLIKSPLVAEYDVTSVKYLVCGAAPLGPDASARVEKVFSGQGALSRQGWGMTEATMAVTLFEPDEHDPTYKGVGYLVPNVEMRVVDSEGRDLGSGEEGEAFIRGPNVFKGYYKNEAATREAWTADGWLKTGDNVVVTSTGLVTIVDRKKELIKVKGFQVAPSELEAHLLQHEGVQDCAVIRVERDGLECPQAHVLRRSEDVTAESIIEFMAKRLSAHKRLTGGVVFAPVIPKSPSGKILRRLLKDPASRATPGPRL